MEIVIRDITELHATENNSRIHTPEQIAQIAKSIQTFGFTNPVLISGKDSIIAGHGRVLAAKLLESTHVPTITLDKLTDDEIRAYIIADNQLALNAGWDFEILKIELAALESTDFDLSILGFDQMELMQINNVGMTEFTSAKDAWDGMPEFTEKNLFFRTIQMHFKDQDDVDSFSELIGQKFTDKTKYLWHPANVPSVFKTRTVESEHE